MLYDHFVDVVVGVSVLSVCVSERVCAMCIFVLVKYKPRYLCICVAILYHTHTHNVNTTHHYCTSIHIRVSILWRNTLFCGGNKHSL